MALPTGTRRDSWYRSDCGPRSAGRPRSASPCRCPRHRWRSAARADNRPR